MAALFYEEVLALRLAAGGEPRALTLDDGFLCDPTSRECVAAADAPRTSYPTAWLPTEKLAEAWKAVTTGAPF